MSWHLPLLLALSIAAVACRSETAPARAATGGRTQVGVVTLKPRSVTLTRELPGRTSAFRVAEVRARVNGIVLKRLFEEGSDVKEGQQLFRIDPAPYRAALDSAQAQLARAEASAASAKVLTERYAELIETNAISRQEHDDALARLKTAQADIAAARAATKAARINLSYTTVTAPVAGRIGRAAVTEGAYVQQSTATLLATVQQLDPVYVDLSASNAEALRLRTALEGKAPRPKGAADVVLLLEDGREYGPRGTLQFADVTVDPSTGSISLRALFPNPRRELLPGMFVRARVTEGVNARALLVPQQAVVRDRNGRPTALVVSPEKKVERRVLTTDRAIGDAWLVTAGLSAGEQVIVDGLQKVRPGADVTPVEAEGAEQAAR